MGRTILKGIRQKSPGGNGKRLQVRRISMSKRITVMIVSVLLAGDIILAAVICSQFRNRLTDAVREKALDLATASAACIDGDAFARISEDEPDSEDYHKVYDQMCVFRDNTSLQFICAYKSIGPDEMAFVIDTDPDEPADFFEPVEKDEPTIATFAGAPTADEGIYEDEWGVYITAYAPIMSQNEVVGIMGIDIDYYGVRKSLRTITLTIVLIFAAMFVGILAAIWYIERRLSSGFLQLNGKIAELADGSGDLNRKIKLETGDEFETIGNTVNDFTDQIQKLISEVATVSNNNANTLGQVNDRIMTVSASMEECSASSASVSSNLDYASHEVGELAGNVRRVGNIAEAANTEALKAKAFAEAHEAEATKQMNRILGEIDKAVSDAKSVEQVRKIAGNIEDIATQTRLLSLNAQIEASHAGKSGKGFSVVATEVQSLSVKISSAVQEIADISDMTIKAMNNLTARVDDITKYISETVAEDYRAFGKLGADYGKSASEIHGEMQQLMDQSDVISGKVSDVSVSIGQINSAVANSATQIEAITESSVKIGDSMNGLLEIPLLKAGMKK